MDEETRWVSPVVRWEDCSPQRQADLRAAWQYGDLSWKLDPNQREVYDLIRKSHKTAKTQAERIFILDIGRQWGKDFLMTLLAHEQAIRVPNSRIPYAAPTKDEVVELLYPITDILLQDCPEDLKPLHKKADYSWTYANGSRIVLLCSMNV